MYEKPLTHTYIIFKKRRHVSAILRIARKIESSPHRFFRYEKNAETFLQVAYRAGKAKEKNREKEKNGPCVSLCLSLCTKFISER